MADDAETRTRRATLRRIVGLSSGLALAGCLRLSSTDGSEDGIVGNTTAPATATADPSMSPEGTPTPGGTVAPEPESLEQQGATPTPDAETPTLQEETPTPGGQTPTSDALVDWLSSANNFTGDVVDRTGQDTVTVAVGAGENSFAFDPAAVTVDSGTTVVWEWTGKGGAHSIVAEDGTFDSGDAVSEAGFTFEYAFSESGIYRYYCRPHRAVGMKGLVEVV
jgi:halocyanin-like protein